MKRISTIFLQSVIILIGILTLLLLIWLPVTEGRAANLSWFHIYTDPFILYGYIASIAFFMALYNAFKLLGLIGKNNIFSTHSVKTLRNIQYCAIILSLFIVWAGLFIRFTHNREDDSAGFLAISMGAVFICLIVATTAAIFAKILQTAVDLKSENDLTV